MKSNLEAEKIVEEKVGEGPDEIADALKATNENQEIQDLAAKNTELEKTASELKDAILREKAETENLRKRYIKEMEDVSKYAITGFAKDIVEILENLYRAESYVVTGQTGEAMLEGMRMTLKSCTDIFKKYNIERLYPKGEHFDPSYHQAMSYAVSSEYEPNTIVEVIQAGYTISGRLLRPALVILSKAEEGN